MKVKRAHVYAVVGIISGILLLTNAFPVVADIWSIAGVDFEEINTSALGQVSTESQNAMPIATAQANYPFDLPTYVPSEYTRNANAETSSFGIVVTWSALNAAYPTEPMILSLTIRALEPDSEDNDYLIGAGEVSEIEINDLPAAIVTGVWDQNDAWLEGDGLETINWRQDGEVYDTWYQLSGASTSTLLEIAESMPHFMEETETSGGASPDIIAPCRGGVYEKVTHEGTAYCSKHFACQSGAKVCMEMTRSYKIRRCCRVSGSVDPCDFHETTRFKRWSISYNCPQ